MALMTSTRQMLAGILLLGMSGTFIELLLLGHDEDRIQLIPLAALSAGVIVVCWHAATASRLSARVLRGVMLVFLVAGVAGLYYHYRANVEFQRESDPSLAGRELLWSVLRAKVPPALAPGVMVQLGLIGLVYTHRPSSDKES
jgi:uncharacterized membrane protein